MFVCLCFCVFVFWDLYILFVCAVCTDLHCCLMLHLSKQSRGDSVIMGIRGCICIYVFVYLCICVSVYLCICICVFVFAKQAADCSSRAGAQQPAGKAALDRCCCITLHLLCKSPTTIWNLAHLYKEEFARKNLLLNSKLSIILVLLLLLGSIFATDGVGTTSCIKVLSF